MNSLSIVLRFSEGAGAEWEVEQVEKFELLEKKEYSIDTVLYLFLIISRN